jgi:Arm DNA-binding domain
MTVPHLHRNKLTDAQLRAWLKSRPAGARDVPDGAVAGLALRLGPHSMTSSLKLRVTGEGGVTKRGRPKKGKTHRLTLGEYPTLTLDAARGTSNTYWDQAKKGISPVKALERGGHRRCNDRRAAREAVPRRIRHDA